MNRMITTFRSQMREAATRKALRHLDNHLLRDIGMPERHETSFSRF
ncbi:MAG: DUF1127 domain-containing protein [Paracoccaceae bacterium]|nr:DUF1127 domain-containing protein [Paracoccaceae bacterium]